MFWQVATGILAASSIVFLFLWLRLKRRVANRYMEMPPLMLRQHKSSSRGFQKKIPEGTFSCYPYIDIQTNLPESEAESVYLS
jgi:hypothetical protein